MIQPSETERTETAVNKPYAIFLSQEKENEHMFKVFSADVVSRLQEYVDIEPVIYCADDLALPEVQRAEYVFATWGMAGLSEEQIAAYMPKLKRVFYAAGSVQDFARPFLNSGVAVHSAWAANAVPVVEYTVAQILLANVAFYQSSAWYKNNGYDAAHAACWAYPGNFKVKVGIIGCGMIGSMVCDRLKQYRVEVLVSDPFASDEKLQALGAKRATLEEIFSQCQTISNHTANLPQTVGMLHGGLFDLMLPSATFINTGRGAQVVEDDLVAALEAEPGRTAVLDVTHPEPVDPEGKLANLSNVILTPHIAGSSGNEIERMGEYMADELVRHLSGEDCLYSVSMKMLETMA